MPTNLYLFKYAEKEKLPYKNFESRTVARLLTIRERMRKYIFGTHIIAICTYILYIPTHTIIMFFFTKVCPTVNLHLANYFLTIKLLKRLYAGLYITAV